MEVTDVECQRESTEVVDNEGGEDDQQDRHQEPEQPPEEARHTASNAHGAQLPPNGQCMQAIRPIPSYPVRTSHTSHEVWAKQARAVLSAVSHER